VQPDLIVARGGGTGFLRPARGAELIHLAQMQKVDQDDCRRADIDDEVQRAGQVVQQRQHDERNDERERSCAHTPSGASQKQWQRDEVEKQQCEH
jgi:hypothetical protein